MMQNKREEFTEDESEYQPEQECVLHCLVCFPFPLHVVPPLLGRGLVQYLFRYCSPVPQIFEQRHHLPQGDQPPFTRNTQRSNL